jgi:hypothetical protein
MRVRIALIAVLFLVPEIALGACPGPGYRGPDGRCVGRAELARVCGNPPSQKCTADRAPAPANDATDMKRFMESYRERAMGY